MEQLQKLTAKIRRRVYVQKKVNGVTRMEQIRDDHVGQPLVRLVSQHNPKKGVQYHGWKRENYERKSDQYEHESKASLLFGATFRLRVDSSTENYVEYDYRVTREHYNERCNTVED